jgi:hypothetical protein
MKPGKTLRLLRPAPKSSRFAVVFAACTDFDTFAADMPDSMETPCYRSFTK